MKNKVISIAISNKTLQTRGALMVALLVIEFALGGLLGSIKLPAMHPGMTGSLMQRGWQGFTWSFTNGGGVALTTHTVLGTLLVLGSIATLGFSIAARHKAWIIASLVGLVGVWVSFFNGIVFVDTNVDMHAAAMGMAGAVALVAYAVGLYFGRSSRR